MQTIFKFCKKCGADSERYADGRCKACTKQRNAKWSAENRQARNEASNKWSTLNKDKRWAIAVKYWENNKEWINAKRRLIRIYSPELERLKAAKRRALKKSSGGALSKNIIAVLLDKQKGLCACCNAPLNGVFHLDHKLPLSRGGENTDDNVQLLLPACNLKKYTLTPEEYKNKLLVIAKPKTT